MMIPMPVATIECVVNRALLWCRDQKSCRDRFHERLRSVAVEISVVFENATTLQQLNARYRQKESPTNILTFASWDDESFPPIPNSSTSMLSEPLGDLVIAVGVVQRESRELGISLEEHLSHLLVHGVLHLLGYDHERGEEEAERQESMEISILESLDIANPYLTS
ncbi:MAG: rRNA maturation RNase YbeY [Magnetococcales bacterium]|nr:rRNA maturation RNase YbeY [Magnetococcales bacterium]